MSKEKTTQAPAIGLTDDAATEVRQSLKKQLNCGSCEGLTRSSVLETRCIDQGRLATSRSCGSHVPDAFTLAGGEEKVNLLLTVSEVMGRMSPNELQIMAALMIGEKATRRHGFKFHQKVYIRVRGESTSNYLSNFAVGYVLSADKDNVKVIGETGRMSATFLNDPDSLTLYTVARFNTIRREMVEQKHYVDPNVRLTMPKPEPVEPKKRSAKGFGAVKTFDEAIEDGLLPKRKRSERGDLVALVARLGRGQLGISKVETSASVMQHQQRPATPVSKTLSSGSVVKFKR
jgi:hypothetical protein